ncbi:MAG: RNA polymerase sigma factor [Actinobacteria bacterium]|nr:RNA polymerase sigma factor [Actinomycetota bacterium]
MAAVPSIGRASLVERPAAHEAAAAHALYESHSRRIYSYCLHQLGSREDAEDAMQIVFMNAFRALRKGVVPQTETAWLFKIAENVCLSRRRSTWRRGKIESPADFELIEELVPGPSGRRDELIGIEDALAAMPEQQRRAILLREWQGLSYKEIAEEMELSQAAVETLIFRARRSLAQGLTEPESSGAKKSRLKRALHGFDLSALAGAAKAILGGSAAVKATAAAVAVTAATGAAVTVTPAVKDAVVKKKTPAIEQTWSQRAATSSATVSAAVAASPVLAAAAGDRSRLAAALATTTPVLGEAGHTSGSGWRVAPEGEEPAAPAAGAPLAAPDEPVASAPAVPPSEPAASPAAPKVEDSRPATAPPAAAAPPKEKETTSVAPVPVAPPKDSHKDSGKGKAETPAAAAPALPVDSAPAPKADEDGKGTRGEESRSPRMPQATDAKPAPVAATQAKDQPSFKEEAKKEAAGKVEDRDAEKSEAKGKEEGPAKSYGPLYNPPFMPPPVTAGQVSAQVVSTPAVSSPPSSSVPAPAPAAAPPVSPPPAEAERKDEKRDEKREDRSKNNRR